MARTATMRVESNTNPAAGLVTRFNNVLKHFLKIDPEGEIFYLSCVQINLLRPLSV